MHAAPSQAPSRPLPGGLLVDGQLRRDHAFRAIDGALELALAEAPRLARHTPQAVTRVLAAALDTLAGGEPSPARIDTLCVADRQWLMAELDRHLGAGPRWRVARCADCRAHFDLQIDPADLPVKPAGPGFPQFSLHWQGHVFGLRVPDGADQAWLAEQHGDGDARQAARALAARLLLSIDEAPASREAATTLPEAWLDALDAALDATAPAVATQALAPCPECGHGNAVALDPYGALARRDGHLLDEVHELASHYHWGERDILALPRARRREYLRRIDAAHGREP